VSWGWSRGVEIELGGLDGDWIDLEEHDVVALREMIVVRVRDSRPRQNGPFESNGEIAVKEIVVGSDQDLAVESSCCMHDDPRKGESRVGLSRWSLNVTRHTRTSAVSSCEHHVRSDQCASTQGIALTMKE
jgi:hypothetical protein